MIINLTPHPINIFEESQVDSSNQRRLYLLDGQIPAKVIPPSGNIANVDIDYVPSGNIDGIPVKEKVVNGIYDPFESSNGDYYYIVSALFKASWIDLGKEHSDRLLTVGQVVYGSQDNPRPVGCLGLIA